MYKVSHDNNVINNINSIEFKIIKIKDYTHIMLNKKIFFEIK